MVHRSVRNRYHPAEAQEVLNLVESCKLKGSDHRKSPRNTLYRRNNVFFEYNGKTITALEATKISGVAYTTIQKRLKIGWVISDAIERPVRQWPVKPAS